MAFTLTSPAFRSGEPIPARHTCDGDGLTPPLKWIGAPAGTRSYVLILEDPDAPGGMFRHWGVYNVDPASTGFAEGQPTGVAALHDFGRPGYFPPCPPAGSGVHRYRFRLFALATGGLQFETPPTCQGLLAMIAADVLGEALLVGACKREA